MSTLDPTVQTLVDHLLCQYCGWYRLDACSCVTRTIDVRRIQAAVNVEHKAAVKRAKASLRTRRAAA